MDKSSRYHRKCVNPSSYSTVLPTCISVCPICNL